MRIEETIPDPLAAEAEAARAWFAAEQASEFKLTGIVDPDTALDEDADARELQLILCGTREGQEVCLRERFRVRSGNGGDFDDRNAGLMLDGGFGDLQWWLAMQEGDDGEARKGDSEGSDS